MATIAGEGSMQDAGYFKYTWETLTNGDDGRGIVVARFPDMSVQVKGTFGAGGTIIVEGSNDGGTTWAALRELDTTAWSLTAAGILGVLENTERLRPRVTAGDGTTDLDVIFIGRSNT